MSVGHNGTSRREFVTTAVAATGLAASAFSTNAWAQDASAKRLDIKIVNSNSTTELAFEELLNRQGYLEQMGLNATTTNVADGTKVIASLVSGSTDVCMKSGFGQLLPAVARGAPVKLIAAANLLTPQGLLTSNAKVPSVPDLAGKTIATGAVGALEYQLMVAILIKYKVDPASVTFVNVGGTPDIFRAISAGGVDAGPVNIDVYNRLTGNTRIIADFFKELKTFPYQGSFTSVASIHKKREALTRVMAAYCKMYRFLGTPESQEPYVQAYMSATKGSAAAAAFQWKFLYDNKPFATDLLFPPHSLDYIQKLNILTKVQAQTMPEDQFVDTSLVPEALKLLQA